jgi:hypothetical protein
VLFWLELLVGEARVRWRWDVLRLVRSTGSCRGAASLE